MTPDSYSPIGRSLNLIARFDDNDSHSLNRVILHTFAIPVLRGRLDVACVIGSAHAELVLARLGRIPGIAP